MTDVRKQAVEAVTGFTRAAHAAGVPSEDAVGALLITASVVAAKIAGREPVAAELIRLAHQLLADEAADHESNGVQVH